MKNELLSNINFKLQFVGFCSLKNLITDYFYLNNSKLRFNEKNNYF